MEKLNLNACKINERFEGDVGIKVMQLALTKNGDYYVTGTLINVKDTWQFKVWDKGLIEKTKAYISNSGGFTPYAAHVKGRVEEFNGNPSFIVTNIEALNDISYEEFIPTLDINKNIELFDKFIYDNVGTNYVKVIRAIMNIDASYFNGESASMGTAIAYLFRKAWAASGKHDAIQGGLVHHTYKMLRIAYTVLENNPSLQEYKDIIYTGIILHDIGKTQEILNGNYTRNSFISHRVMAIEYMASLKSSIVLEIGIDDYYRLLDILIGHHDQFEQPAKTAWGYLVHLIDMLDTWATIIEQEVTSDMVATNAAGEHTFRMGDKFLTF